MADGTGSVAGQSGNRYRDCSPDELGEAIGQLHGLMSAVHRSLLEVVAAFDVAKGWKTDGAGSGAEWLMGTLGVAHATASVWVHTARALEARPAMAAAFADGLLSFDKIVPLSRVTDPADDERATEEAIGLSAAQVRLGWLPGGSVHPTKRPRLRPTGVAPCGFASTTRTTCTCSGAFRPCRARWWPRPSNA